MGEGRVIFRVDGNSRIGLGHIMRCRALADLLRSQATCLFATRTSDEAVTASLRRDGFAVEAAPGDSGEKSDASWLGQAIGRAGDTIVLDGYSFDESYQRALKKRGFRLVCLDDLHQGHFVADIVINHGGADPSAYDREPYTRLCLGPAYALLRAPFLQAMADTRPALAPDSVMVCFGGSDPQDLTRKALLACRKLPGIRRIELVIGQAYRGAELLHAEAKNAGLVATMVHTDLAAEELAGLIRRCAFAITSPSTVAYEVCAVTAGLIVCPYADNQRELAHFLARSGAAALCEGLLAKSAAQFRDELLPLVRESLFRQQMAAQRACFQSGVAENLRSLFI